MDYNKIPSPCYVIDEQLLRENLTLIKSVKERAEVEIILAFKAFATWKVFPIIREYIACSTASSLSEARLAVEEMGSKAHTYAPVYTATEFPQIAACSSHITFNSLAQFEKYFPQTQNHKHQISCGLRINPEVSVVETDLYNPAVAGSRLGIVAADLPEKLPEGVEGLHFHVLCESSSYDLEKVLNAVEADFGKYFSQIKWLNMGGGHLMTRKNYDVEHLIALLKNFKVKYPHLQIILEPGAAFVWQTGVLLATVQDIVENHGIKTAMLDVSFACHLPDCLEMPYKPTIAGATDEVVGKPTYRMGGNSCLSGDYVGSWSFEKPLTAGDKIVFEDMIHYTTVKTTLFNGVSHPSIGIWTQNNDFQLIRKFGYEDYKGRMG
ncbi:MAG: carboxynorspermidine decarboxylase [Paludibacter sp.]|jgi:carboxynorspermidine decarboxylase|nr:carboxynorspermidine decarboxylase [Paludibacter sp.]